MVSDDADTMDVIFRGDEEMIQRAREVYSI